MKTKKELRKEMKAMRQALTKEQIAGESEKIINRLLETEEYKNAKTIFSYVSFEEEADTIVFIRQALSDGKKVAVPKVSGKEMEFYPITSLDELQPGYYGILEPVTNDIAKETEGMLIVPGLAFDFSYNRMGYGGGFYDRYLNTHPEHQLMKAALAYDFQMVPEMETEQYDQKMDMIITPSKIWKRETGK